MKVISISSKTKFHAQSFRGIVQVIIGCILMTFLEACSVSSEHELDANIDSETSWILSDITPDDIHFMKPSFQFEFDTLDYGIYAKFEVTEESRFQERCENLTTSSGSLKRMIIDAEQISLSDGRHGFDRGIDHCGLYKTVLINNDVYDLALSAFGVGVLWPAEPGGGSERYFLTKNCEHSISYIKWYFAETKQHPGLDDFQSSSEVIEFFCQKTVPN